MKLGYIAILLLSSAIMICSSQRSDSYNPLIIVPGLAGSRLYFTEPNKPKVKLIWVNPYYLVRMGLMIKYMKLQYNRTTHSTFNPYGFTYTSKEFGNPHMIEQLSKIPYLAATDYHWMIKKILRNLYYKRNITLKAAPYDFRKAPNELGEFFIKLKSMVEETYTNRTRTKVVLLGHSLGCMTTLYFLKKMSNDWKQTYLKTFICVSSPLAGTVRDLLMMTTGRSVIFFDNPLLFREFEKTFPTSAFLLPRPEIFQNKTLVQTAIKKYTAKSYSELFNDMNMTDAYLMYKNEKDLVIGSESPTGLDEVFCIHGIGISTIESYSIKSFDDIHPLYKYGPGDGTVNLGSLQVCKNWKNVDYSVIIGANHKNILHNDAFLRKLMAILVNKQKV